MTVLDRLCSWSQREKFEFEKLYKERSIKYAADTAVYATYNYFKPLEDKVKDKNLALSDLEEKHNKLELDDRVNEMMRERERQDAEARARYAANPHPSPTRPIVERPMG